MPVTRAAKPRAATDAPLRGAALVLTRASGSARSEARRVRRLGGEPLLLPGVRIAPPGDCGQARAALLAALHAPVCIFVSVAAVRSAARLAPLRPAPSTRLLAVGAATARALDGQGLSGALVPLRADSEGLLALSALDPPPAVVGLVGAPDGRRLLPEALAARGARVLTAEVYRRLPARLDRRHLEPLRRSRRPLYVLVSSIETLRSLLHALPSPLRARLLSGSAVASSPRVAAAARSAGFSRVLQAASALSADMVETACTEHTRSSRPRR